MEVRQIKTSCGGLSVNRSKIKVMQLNPTNLNSQLISNIKGSSGPPLCYVNQSSGEEQVLSIESSKFIPKSTKFNNIKPYSKYAIKPLFVIFFSFNI